MFFTEDQFRQINAIFDRAADDARDTLYEYEVYEILRAAGLSVPRYLAVASAAALDAAALAAMPDTLVLKVISPQIAHKQKVGGVKVLGNTTAGSVRAAIRAMEADILSHFPPDAPPRITGFLLTEFIQFPHAIGYEVLFGIQDDPAFGPVLTVSKGGDDAEFFAKYYDPANLIMPPLDGRRPRRLSTASTSATSLKTSAIRNTCICLKTPYRCSASLRTPTP